MVCARISGNPEQIHQFSHRIQFVKTMIARI